MQKKLVKYIFILLIIFIANANIKDVRADGLNVEGIQGKICQYYVPRKAGENYLIINYTNSKYQFDSTGISSINQLNKQWVGNTCPKYIYRFSYNGDSLGAVDIGIVDKIPLFWFSNEDLSYEQLNSTLGGFIIDSIEKYSQYTWSGKYYGIDDMNNGKTINEAKKVLDDAFEEPLDNNKGCAILSEAIKEKINWVLNLLKYGGTALAILFGMVDFMKAVGSDEDNATKKAGSKLAKRLIAAAIMFLIPLVLQFLLNTIKIPGITTNDVTCGIGVSE